MRRIATVLLFLPFILAGCSLSGDGGSDKASQRVLFHTNRDGSF